MNERSERVRRQHERVGAGWMNSERKLSVCEIVADVSMTLRNEHVASPYERDMFVSMQSARAALLVEEMNRRTGDARERRLAEWFCAAIAARHAALGAPPLRAIRVSVEGYRALRRWADTRGSAPIEEERMLSATGFELVPA